MLQGAPELSWKRLEVAPDLTTRHSVARLTEGGQYADMGLCGGERLS